MSEKVAVGVDIGGTKLAFALIDQNGSLLASHQLPTSPQRGSLAVLDDIAAGINHLLRQSPGEVLGVGIGTPGYTVPETGMVYGAVNLGWQELNLRDEVQQRMEIRLPVFIRKDADASLLGEVFCGSARDCRDALYVCVGSGLGGAAITGGRLITGASGMTVDIGHIYLIPDGRQCACGSYGCAETLISGPGLVAETRQQMAQGTWKTALQDNEMLSPSEIITAARTGDLLACHVIANLASSLGQVLAMCISILNPAMIILAGGVILSGFDIIVPEAVEEMKRHSLPHCTQTLRIVPSGLTSSAIGAASLVYYRENEVLRR